MINQILTEIDGVGSSEGKVLRPYFRGWVPKMWFIDGDGNEDVQKLYRQYPLRDGLRVLPDDYIYQVGGGTKWVEDRMVEAAAPGPDQTFDSLRMSFVEVLSRDGTIGCLRATRCQSWNDFLPSP